MVNHPITVSPIVKVLSSMGNNSFVNLYENVGMSYRERLKLAMSQSEHSTPTKLFRAAKLRSSQLVSQVIHGPTQQFNSSNHEAVCKALGVCSDWLLHGTPPMRPVQNEDGFIERRKATVDNPYPNAPKPTLSPIASMHDIANAFTQMSEPEKEALITMLLVLRNQQSEPKKDGVVPRITQ